MFLDWWKAHRWEYIVDLIAVAVFLAGVLGMACYFWIRERMRRP
jgi:hypothetical protein